MPTRPLVHESGVSRRDALDDSGGSGDASAAVDEDVELSVGVASEAEEEQGQVAIRTAERRSSRESTAESVDVCVSSPPRRAGSKGVGAA